jgi:hypothetical protein
LNMAFKKIKITEPKRIIQTEQGEEAVRFEEEPEPKIVEQTESVLLSKYNDVLTDEDNSSSSESKSTSWMDMITDFVNKHM